ncbi:MAG: hypothetical protein LCH91_00380 [Bacteroidetes bacterium]|nr:hypothetical protein [Bacteroidota bacterium]
MRIKSYLLILGCLLSYVSSAQLSFTASWDFENNSNGNSNNPNISVSSLNITGVRLLGYPAGQTGDAVSLQFWPTGELSSTDYAEVSVTSPNYRFSLSSISFSFNRTTDGPNQIAVRSSQDNFSNNLGTSAVGSGFAGLNAPLFINDAQGTITFRIYGYAATSSQGALRLDNLRINGTVILNPLPVELTHFQGKAFLNQIELNWGTAWERNSSHFDIQRSADLKEFVTIGRTPSRGDHLTQTTYQFADLTPLVGINYYRLRQTDLDGSTEFSKIIAVKIEPEQPQIWVFENPTSAQSIRIRLHKLHPTDLKLVSMLGQEIPFGWVSTGFDEYILKTNVPEGFYWLVSTNYLPLVNNKLWLTPTP